MDSHVRGPHKKRVPFADTLIGRIALGSIVPGLLLFAWYLGIRSGTAVVPTFGEVYDVLANPFDQPRDIYSRSIAFSMMMTLLRLTIGFGLGAASGLFAGLAAGQSRTLDRILQPAVQMARPINPIVLLPIATVLFGISSFSTVLYGGERAWEHDILDQVQIAMVFILWWGAFFPVFISTVHGVRSTRTAYLETMHLMGATRRQVFRRVLLPHALPSSLSGMRIALGVTWLVLIAAEVFPGTRSGLGYMLCVACKTSDYEFTFAAIILIGLIAWITDAIMHQVEMRISHWVAVDK